MVKSQRGLTVKPLTHTFPNIICDTTVKKANLTEYLREKIWMIMTVRQRE